MKIKNRNNEIVEIERRKGKVMVEDIEVDLDVKKKNVRKDMKEI